MVDYFNFKIMSRVILLLMALTAVMSVHLVHEGSTPTIDLASLRQSELAKHNTYRAKHGVQSLKLNDTLNAAAQAYANKLAASHQFAHSPEAQGGKYGENLYWGWGRPSFIYKPGTATDSWYNEIAYYDFNTGESTQPDQMVGHFTAMIWKTVSQVGFGAATVAEDNGFAIYVVANYSPTPNVVGSFQQNVLRPIK